MLVDKLKGIVGPGNFTTDSHELEPHLREWRDIWTGRTLLLVRPDTTIKVAAVVRACHESNTAVVPQGGNTGLCGGAIPDDSGDQVLLSLSGMNKIRALSANDHTVTADAGCTLAAIQNAAADAQRFFPLSLAAEGSCQIGGNLSTNAGGINVLRYGTARNLALGLEVVLPDGTIWDGLRALRKDTAGYDLKQLFIGAEGTLGVITAACLRLFPAVQNPQTAFVSVNSPTAAVSLLAELRQQLADQLQAFELIPDRAIQFVEKHIPDTRAPSSDSSQWYVLLEVANLADEELLESALMSCFDRELITDATIAKNRGEAASLWGVRHAISEAQKKEGASLKHDVSVPVAEVGNFVELASRAVEDYIPGIRPVAFGHVGDGNIHFNLSQPKDWLPAAFLDERETLAELVYGCVDRFDGSISAEHGVGQAKKADLRRYRGNLEVDLMRTVKQALDPRNIMNPGKVF
ncbi:MAG: FAD-binding oxidoreductase [Woeseiaceae bacterium]